MKRRLIWLVLLSVLHVSLGAQAAFASPKGAIFTTLVDGSRVNANIYEDKNDVYLDGGPGPNAPPGAAALPDGDYYFQVTDPSGKTLLSADAVKYRRFTVANGVIVSAHNHPTGVDKDYGGPPLNAVTVKLMPYKDTPNPGGVYKVWATPVDKFTGDPNKVDTPSQKFHGFDPAWSKTDNFKVKGKPEQRLIVKKFWDTNADGVWDEGDYEVFGWPLKIVEPTSVVNDPLYSRVDIISQLTGTWKVTEYAKPIVGCDLDWVQTALYLDDVKLPTSPSVDVKFGKTDGETHIVAFGNIPRHTIVAEKFNDKNCNGIQDEGEEDLAGVKFTLTGSGAWGTYGPVTKTTGVDGKATFDKLLPGTYTLEEEVPEGWLPTTPAKVENIMLSGYPTCEPAKYVKTFGFGNVESVEITVCKFEDKNGNGLVDEGEPKVANFGIRLQGPNGFDETRYTGDDGCVTFSKLYPGTYTVTELIPEGSDWKPTALYYRASEGMEFTKAEGAPISVELDMKPGEKGAVKFLNCKTGCLKAFKFYDANKNGTYDEGEKPIEGWKIELWKDGVLLDTKYTDKDGWVEFAELDPGLYTVREIMPATGGWKASTVTEYVDVPVVSMECNDSSKFGNYCEYTADFGTKGWWSNPNGNPLITQADIDYLNGLAYPVDPADLSSPLMAPYMYPTEYWDTPFADRFEIGAFIISNVDASPHRFQLAQQLCAFILNVRHYAGGPGAMIYMGSGPVENAEDLIKGAVAAWYAGDSSECSEWIKKLDGYNNCDMVGVIMSEPCPVVY